MRDTDTINAGLCHTYRFSLTAGRPYTFTFCDGGAYYSADTILTLYNFNCTQVAHNHGFCSSPPNWGSEFTIFYPAPGTYYVSLRSLSNST